MDAYLPPRNETDLSDTLATHRDRWYVAVRLGRMMLFFYPIFAATLPYLFCVVFWLAFGRMPKPYADDLSGQTVLLSYPYSLAILLMASYPFFIAAELVISWYGSKRGFIQKLTRTVVYVCQCLLAWLIVTSDNPINEWFFD